mmetsp:Transcript_48769/g.106178  ORF Transcript_48769/g.106178 Transcript_48769/m.106178 type:complete len:112 (+) Transcript_48769:134-469(+)
MADKYVCAILMLTLAGKAPSAKGVKDLLTAGGISVDEKEMKFVLSAAEGKSVEELIKEGTGKLEVSGGGGGAAPAAAAAGGAAEAGAAAAAPKKEEVEEEEEEGMDFDLFG